MKFYVVAESVDESRLGKLGAVVLDKEKCFIQKTPFGHGDWGWRLLVEAEGYSKEWRNRGYKYAGLPEEPLTKRRPLSLLSPDPKS